MIINMGPMCPIFILLSRNPKLKFEKGLKPLFQIIPFIGVLVNSNSANPLPTLISGIGKEGLTFHIE
jgi:hypothetical protein